MVRTQIELTEQQAAELQKRAAAQGLSLSEMIRRGIDVYLASSQPAAASDLQRRRAMDAAGRFAGPKDLSSEHDRHLAEA